MQGANEDEAGWRTTLASKPVDESQELRADKPLSSTEAHLGTSSVIPWGGQTTQNPVLH